MTNIIGKATLNGLVNTRTKFKIHNSIQQPPLVVGGVFSVYKAADKVRLHFTILLRTELNKHDAATTMISKSVSVM